MAVVLVAGAAFLSTFVNAFTTVVAQKIAICNKKKSFPWATDGDDRRRPCTVRWYTRRICGLGNHWAFTFDWGDYKATYEADEVDGYLIPRWKTGGPYQGPPGSETRYQWNQLMTFQVTCSPSAVNQYAFDVIFNGVKYILTKINCQLWVRCLAKALGIKHTDLDACRELLIPAPLIMIADWLNKGSASNMINAAGHCRSYKSS